MRSLAGLVRASLLVLVVVAVGGCFNAKEPDCAFSCDVANPECPSGYTCLADGYCHKGTHTGECSGFPGHQTDGPPQVDVGQTDVLEDAAQEDAQDDAKQEDAGHCGSDNCTGCCDGDTCITTGNQTNAKCGRNGDSCAACDADTTSTCHIGRCSCGTSGAACADGSHCNDSVGTCFCDTTTGCAGCCDGTTCVPLANTNKQHCGKDGNACSACDLRADSCGSGACTCGANAGCASGQRCDTTSTPTCVCDSTSDCGGCCNGADCVASPDVNECGTGGEVCDVCTGTHPKGNACISGNCECGGNSACNADQQCVSSACQCWTSPCCDINTCPNSCCGNGTCQPLDLNHCGSGGGSCTDCAATYGDRANLCDSTGQCVCGSGTQPCAVGQRCFGAGTAATCVCDLISCGNGCCDTNGACLTTLRTKDKCGSGGNACTACSSITADSCNTATGVCECTYNTGGSGAECSPNLQCESGGCTCTAASCVTGCCASNTCHIAEEAACGSGGGSCSDCVTTYGIRVNLCNGSGACACGSTGGPCAVGQECVGLGALATCQCTTNSCGSGCCVGTACHTADVAACGTSAGSCTNCTSAYGIRVNLCNGSGACACGSTGGPCVAGQECVGAGAAATCQCTTNSCGSGCCVGTACHTADVAACGTSAGSCTDCTSTYGIRVNLCNGSGACACGSTGGPCVAGQECVGAGAAATCQCTTNSCGSGCCVGTACHTADVAACGTSAGSCTDCTSTYGIRVNLCNGSGACACGSTGGPCAAGQECVGAGAAATCQCTTNSCGSGCCVGTACHTADVAACGTSAGSCTDCTSAYGIRVNLCNGSGACACGSTGGPCVAGQECVGAGAAATCQCTTNSCGSGCCVGTACHTADVAACGTSAGSCTDCTSAYGIRVNLCNGSGACACGSTGGPCAAGQECVGVGAAATCQCTTNSCGSGCCVGTACHTADVAACGTSAGSCTDCTSTYGIRVNLCNGSGACACGSTGGPCVAGQECVGAGAGATCQCTTNSCGSGCCVGTACHTADVAACGTSAGSCTNCTTTYGIRVNLCDGSGACACGSTGGPCAAGLECVGAGAGATCQCTSNSCATCCQGGATGTCAGADIGHCGTNGAACWSCETAQSAGLASACGSTTNECLCGVSPACAAGDQACVSDVCQCDQTKCGGLNGCCATTGHCIAEATFPNCEQSDGNACASLCDPVTADQCVGTACSCGAGGTTCGTNEVCNGGSCVYSHTIVIDGTNDFITAAAGSGESFATSTAGFSGYVAWDLDNLYVGYAGPDISPGDATHWLLIYLDTGTGGSSTGQTYNTQTPTLPFTANYYVRWRTNDVVNYVPGQTYSSSWGDYTIAGLDHSRGSGFVELKIPFASIGNPTTVGVVAFMINEQSLSEWTYAGLPGDTLSDEYNQSPTKYLLVDRTSDLFPNTASNEH